MTILYQEHIKNHVEADAEFQRLQKEVEDCVLLLEKTRMRLYNRQSLLISSMFHPTSMFYPTSAD